MEYAFLGEDNDGKRMMLHIVPCWSVLSLPRMRLMIFTSNSRSQSCWALVCLLIQLLFSRLEHSLDTYVPGHSEEVQQDHKIPLSRFVERRNRREIDRIRFSAIFPVEVDCRRAISRQCATRLH